MASKTFADAMSSVADGYMVRRKGWNWPVGVLKFYHRDGLILIEFGKDRLVRYVGAWHPRLEDFSANDWECVELWHAN